MKDNHKIRQAILHISYACTHHCPMCYANAKYKITDKLHNHRLRHTRITRWKEQGVDMNAIQYLAGHVEGSEITDKVYIDVSENFAFKQLEKVI